MNSCKNCGRYLAGQVAAVLSDQFSKSQAEKCEQFGEVEDEGLATCYVIYQLYKDQGRNGIVRLCKTGDASILATYASKRFINKIKAQFENAGQYPYNVMTIDEDVERMSTINYKSLSNDVSKVRGYNDKRHSLTSKNVVESLAKTNPELFNKSKLMQIQASENIADEFNKFIENILQVIFKKIDIVEDSPYAKEVGKYNAMQEQCN